MSKTARPSFSANVRGGLSHLARPTAKPGSSFTFVPHADAGPQRAGAHQHLIGIGDRPEIAGPGLGHERARARRRQGRQAETLEVAVERLPRTIRYRRGGWCAGTGRIRSTARDGGSRRTSRPRPRRSSNSAAVASSIRFRAGRAGPSAAGCDCDPVEADPRAQIGLSAPRAGVPVASATRSIALKRPATPAASARTRTPSPAYSVSQIRHRLQERGLAGAVRAHLRIGIDRGFADDIEDDGAEA
jgi:hypothetical protein